MPCVEVEHGFTAAPVSAGPVSARVRSVAAMFGLGLDAQRRVQVVPRTSVPVRRGSVVFVTGASGGGKSTLLRELARRLRGDAEAPPVWDVASLPESVDAPLIDALPTPTLEDALRVLARAGLNDAFVMLRRPSELSDGQRYRFTLARLMAAVESAHAAQEDPEHRGDQQYEFGREGSGHGGDAAGPERREPPTAVVLMDEFGATLDRLTVKVVARNLRRWVARSGVCAVVATTHDDLLEALRPDVLIEQHLGGRLTVSQRDAVFLSSKSSEAVASEEAS